MYKLLSTSPSRVPKLGILGILDKTPIGIINLKILCTMWFLTEISNVGRRLQELLWVAFTWTEICERAILVAGFWPMYLMYLPLGANKIIVLLKYLNFCSEGQDIGSHFPPKKWEMNKYRCFLFQKRQTVPANEILRWWSYVHHGLKKWWTFFLSGGLNFFMRYYIHLP